MTEKTRTKNYSKTGASTLEFDDFELQATMQNFLQEEEKETGKGIWNFATLSGMVMLFTGFMFALQWIGIPIGDFLTDFSTGLISALPLIGGALVTLIGFGFFVGDRRREKKAERIKKRQQKAARKVRKRMDDVHGAESTTSSYGKLKNDLSGDFESTAQSSSYNDFGVDSFGYRHVKRLMKSRTDKKIAGVCGGIAKYFGISSTVTRFLFLFLTPVMSGMNILIYFILALAMPKEPIELMDDFDF